MATGTSEDRAGVRSSADVLTSRRWRTPRSPLVAVHVATHRRPEFLADLIASIEAQTLQPDQYEVAVVDDGSGDETWATLRGLVDRTDLALLAVRSTVNRGQAAARNAAVRATSARLVAFTDDDCLPTPGWLRALLEVGDRGHVDIVQGRTEPGPPGTATGAWDRTIRIVGPTPLFETCNIAYRRDAFESAGGFDEAAPVTGRTGTHSFGEDVLLGAAVTAAGGERAFASEALVFHRYLPTSYVTRVRLMAELSGFPALVARAPELASALRAGIFLSGRTAAFDAALVSAVLAGSTRRPWLLLGTLPWVRDARRQARDHGGRPLPVRLVQLAVLDAAGTVALIGGSVRHRRLVL